MVWGHVWGSLSIKIVIFDYKTENHVFSAWYQSEKLDLTGLSGISSGVRSVTPGTHCPWLRPLGCASKETYFHFLRILGFLAISYFRYKKYVIKATHVMDWKLKQLSNFGHSDGHGHVCPWFEGKCPWVWNSSFSFTEYKEMTTTLRKHIFGSQSIAGRFVHLPWDLTEDWAVLIFIRYPNTQHSLQGIYFCWAQIHVSIIGYGASI